MATELQDLKDCVEDGDSWVEALEKVDLVKMREEGNGDVADKIEKVLDLIGEISDNAGVD